MPGCLNTAKKTLVGSEILCYLYSNDIVYQILIFINFFHTTFKDDFSYATIARLFFHERVEMKRDFACIVNTGGSKGPMYNP